MISKTYIDVLALEARGVERAKAFNKKLRTTKNKKEKITFRMVVRKINKSTT